MDLDAFLESLALSTPLGGLSPALRALWLERNGSWDAAHRLVQDDSGSAAAWVHAYLHRVEGDLGNAAYWYRQAGRPLSSKDTLIEWEEIAAELLRSFTDKNADRQQ